MKPLFVTAHYDDMEICAGGTAYRYGGTSVVLYPKPAAGTRMEAIEAARILDVQMRRVSHIDREAVVELTAMAAEHDVIIATSPWDSHPEHRLAANMARQAARKNNVSLWFMDHAIPGGRGRGPRPNHFVMFGGKGKYDAIDQYAVIGADEKKAVKFRDRYYGAIHGSEFAEGFYIEHHIQ